MEDPQASQEIERDLSVEGGVSSTRQEGVEDGADATEVAKFQMRESDQEQTERAGEKDDENQTKGNDDDREDTVREDTFGEESESAAAAEEVEEVEEEQLGLSDSQVPLHFFSHCWLKS